MWTKTMQQANKISNPKDFDPRKMVFMVSQYIEEELDRYLLILE